jgi:hypothetical protein
MGFLPGGNSTTIRLQIKYITQNNTTFKQNTAHKTTQTIKDTLYIRNTTQIQLQLQQIQLQIQLNKLILIKNNYTIQ